jgi:adenosylmethionine-8-amino-7-oxononanoate aminotransferase
MTQQPDWLTEGWPHIWLPYTQMQTAAMPLPVVSANGSVIELADGRKLVDGIASWWSMCHGYQHPDIIKAIVKQAEGLSHVMFGGLAHEPAYTLATRLCAITHCGMERVFFSDSGSIAVEVALKMALQYWRNKGESKRTKFICFNHGYHGDTLGAMSVSARGPFTSAYDGVSLKNFQLDLPNDEYSFAEFTDTVNAVGAQVAAIIIEPLVQAAGGFRFHSADILSEVRRVAREHNILFIVDEIATGFGRTGSMFACHEAAIQSDIMCVGKALTGGHMPLAATLATAEVFNGFLSESIEQALMHGPTFMAHPIACAAALASLDLFVLEPRIAQAEALEQALFDGLKEFRNLDSVVDVRVKGAIGVVETTLSPDVLRGLRDQFIEHGAWIRPLGNIVYLMPPLTISDAELETLFAAIGKVLE